MIVFVAAYAAAASMAPLSYRPFEHGVDDLGCQQYKKSWIMKGGYLGYSALLLMNAVYAFLIGKTPLYPSLLVAGQALFAGASAFFSKRPFFRVDSFNEAEHHSHERLIQISFVLANSAMVTAWFFTDSPYRILHLALGIACFFLFSLHRLAPACQGFYQKCLYALILLWQAILFPHNY